MTNANVTSWIRREINSFHVTYILHHLPSARHQGRKKDWASLRCRGSNRYRIFRQTLRESSGSNPRDRILGIPRGIIPYREIFVNGSFCVFWRSRTQQKNRPIGGKMRKGIDKGVELVYNKGVGAAGDGCFLASRKRWPLSLEGCGGYLFLLWLLL